MNDGGRIVSNLGPAEARSVFGVRKDGARADRMMLRPWTAAEWALIQAWADLGSGLIIEVRQAGLPAYPDLSDPSELAEHHETGGLW